MRDRKSTRLNSSHLGNSYAVHRDLHSFPTRRSSDLVARAPGVNLREDPASMLRLIRLTADDNDPDALVRRSATYQPRRDAFADDFAGALAPDWIADAHHA